MTTDEEIGKELVRQHGGRSESIETLSSSVIRQAKRRLRSFGIVAIVLWVLTTAASVLAVRSFFVFIYPILAEWALTVEPAGIDGRVQLIPRLCMIATYVCVGLLGLAALATVLLIGESRKSTLRQIRASLADISAELKELSQESTSR